MMSRAEGFLQSGNPEEALRLMHPLRLTASDVPRVQWICGRALLMCGKHVAASEMLGRLASFAPDESDVLTQHAMALKRSGKFEEALGQVERSRRVQKWQMWGVGLHAELLVDLNRHDEALEVITEAEREAPDGTLTNQARAQLLAVKARLTPERIEPEAMLREMDPVLDDDSVSSNARGTLATRAGQILERMGRYDEAFAYFVRAKSFATTPWDAAKHSRRVDGLIEAWTSGEAAKAPKAKVDGSGLIFILGMPRSGSSLMEQMVSSHPSVVALGECSQIQQAGGAIEGMAGSPSRVAAILAEKGEPSLRALAKRVLEEYSALAGNSGPLMTDKQPFNFFFVPLISRLLPGARVIHTRRNPIDTCLSYFTLWFNRRHPQAGDLKSLGAFYRDYERMMSAWRDLAPPDERPEMIEVLYEDVVADPERVMREVLGFLGLEWDDRVTRPDESDRVVATASRDQVKRRVYTSSVERWRRYEKHLGPLLTALGMESETKGRAD